MDLSNLNYQPVNIASGIPQAFAAGASAVPDLSARVAQLLDRSMAESGQTQRSNYSAQLSAGYRPEGGVPGMQQEGLSFEDALKFGNKAAKEHGPGMNFTIKTKEGHNIAWKGEKTNADEALAEKLTKTEAAIRYKYDEPPPDELQKMYFRNVMLINKAKAYAADNNITIEEAMAQMFGTPQEETPPKSWGARIGEGLNTIGSAVGNLGVPNVMAAGNMAMNAGAGQVTNASNKAALIEEARRRGLIK